MTQTICDRCGRPVNPNIMLRPEDMPLPIIYLVKRIGDNTAQEKVDLCLDCAKVFKRWMGWKPNNEAK